MASGSSSYPNAYAIVIAVSPETLLDSSSRYVCEVCFQGFPRQQNLSLHRRAHNLPFVLKTRTPNEPVPRKVYICPEPTCVHHNRSRAIGDFGGLKKHYLRKHHMEKKHKCDICSKEYGVESDLKAHYKLCVQRSCICQLCGSRFSRDNFTAHQEHCVARERVGAVTSTTNNNNNVPIGSIISHPQTLGMRDSTFRINSNESSRTQIGPQISYIQNQSNYYPFTTPYQSELSQFGADHSSLMTYPSTGLNFTEVPHQLQPTSTTRNEQGSQYYFDLAFYADLLRDKTPLPNDGGFMPDPSGSHNLTPGMHNVGPNGKPNPGTGSSVGGGYEQGVYNGYGAESYGPYQLQQPLHNVQDTNVLDPSKSYNLTPARHNLGLDEILNPVTGSSGVGSFEQGGYMAYFNDNGPLYSDQEKY